MAMVAEERQTDVTAEVGVKCDSYAGSLIFCTKIISRSGVSAQ